MTGSTEQIKSMSASEVGTGVVTKVITGLVGTHHHFGFYGGRQPAHLVRVPTQTKRGPQKEPWRDLQALILHLSIKGMLTMKQLAIDTFYYRVTDLF